MKWGGLGSASIVLVFAVLCLSIFATIAYVSALTDETLITAEVQLVSAYYRADTLAEQILEVILSAQLIPDNINGIEITSYWDWELMAEIVSFALPILDTHVLCISVAINSGSYDILTWRMRDITNWQTDDRLHVWQGF